MSAHPIEIQDVTRVLSQLVMPSPRRPNAAGATLKHLAPIEMAAQSIHMHQPYHSLQAPGPPSGKDKSSVAVSIAPVLDPAPSSGQSKPAFLVHGWGIPLGYTLCGLCMGLCNLVAPGFTPECAHLLCPLWTLALGLHAAAEHDPVWAWCGLLCVLLLPFVILVRDFLFAAFYLLVFTGFTSGRFWQFFQGPTFILLSICWVGLCVCCGLSLGAEHPCAQISVAGFFSLTAGIISSSRLSKLTFRIG